jgi:DNA-binding MarR family transcriptional regulator
MREQSFAIATSSRPAVTACPACSNTVHCTLVLVRAEVGPGLSPGSPPATPRGGAGWDPRYYFLDNSFLRYYYRPMRNRPLNTKAAGNIPASQLRGHIGFWMRLVSNHVSYSFARKLETSGVTVAEWVLLREMYGGDQTTAPSEVAGLTGLTRGAVSKLISRLLEKGLVTRKESSSDRRYQDVALTPPAVALVPKLAKLADENDREFFGVLSKAERRILTGLLRKTAALHTLTKVPVD